MISARLGTDIKLVLRAASSILVHLLSVEIRGSCEPRETAAIEFYNSVQSSTLPELPALSGHCAETLPDFSTSPNKTNSLPTFCLAERS